MTALIKFEDLDIPALTVIVAEQYEECLWAIEKALDKQLAFGLVLTDRKWKSAQRYMRGADSIATDPSLLECADSLDGILKIVEDRKPAVEVAEVAASVPTDNDAGADRTKKKPCDGGTIAGHSIFDSPLTRRRHNNTTNNEHGNHTHGRDIRQERTPYRQAE